MPKRQPKRAVIFANGKLSSKEAILAMLQPDDIILAADGGSQHCLELGLSPAVVIGDFDSLDKEALNALINAGVEVIRHPAHKDYTDLELAIRHAQSLGIDHVLVFAALGARWDQTLANLLLPAADDLASMRIRLVDGSQEMVLLRAGERLVIHGREGDTVSLIPLAGDAHGISTEGLAYPLDNDTLYFGATRGLSNVMLSQRATISLGEGLLLCTIIHI